jgi:spermidine synthase
MSYTVPRPRILLSLLFGLTIFLGAFLLFSVQPMFAKMILPWFGGSAAVWTTCLVFFQTALLAGYSYSWRLTKTSRPKRQAILHVGLLMAAIATLPVEAGPRWRPTPDSLGHPALQILWMLTAVLGLPYFLLSTTGPLLQSWYARSGEAPYRLFALSNAGALIALVSYPLLVEPRLPAHLQDRIWSIGFVVFAVLCGLTGWFSATHAGETVCPTIQTARSTKRVYAEWIALSAAGSMLLLATTNQLTQNVAPVPMLWMVPLAIYLVAFILAFEKPGWYRRDLLLRLLAIALASIAYAIADIKLSDAIIVSIPLFCGGLFLGCMFCHGELNRLKPASSEVTSFYLMISLGGAIGAIFVGLVAPVMFSGIYELPVALIAVALLALWMNRDRGHGQRLLWSAVSLAMVVLAVSQAIAYHRDAVELQRSFYGSLRVVDSSGIRTLYHGIIEHGSQFLSPDQRRTPTTYYSEGSGAGMALRSFAIPKRVGVIGLGAGTLAAYGRSGDEFRFYEINPQVIEIAHRQFSYLGDSAAKIEITLGDARLSLEGEPASRELDVLLVDAFSGDAIPVHLLTKEAFALYLRHLKPEGVLAIHVSNQYLDLTPVVGQLAGLFDLPAVEIRSPKDESRQISEAVWILMTRKRDFFSQAGFVTPMPGSRVLPVRALAERSVWTDDYNNLFQVMRWIPN